MDIDPVRLCCGQRHSTVACPDGRVMCCICFSRFEQDELYVDDDGNRWDVCLQCRRDEEEVLRRTSNRKSAG